jgi:hypothetical protein
MVLGEDRQSGDGCSAKYFAMNDLCAGDALVPAVLRPAEGEQCG